MWRLIYVPLEPLPERYTVQLSAPKTGWLESRWLAANIPYRRIEGKSLTSTIEKGSVLDANGRGYWACSQIMEILRLLYQGEITNSDVFYFDDFWHPGISALPYSFHLTGVHPRMYTMLHAQSVDKYDFTYPMRHWMRHFEVGIGKILNGIFVTSTCLRDLLLYAGIGDSDTVHIAGLPFNSDEVRTHWPEKLPTKKRQVVFSSRWDKEKCPLFFLQIVERMNITHPEVRFVVTTSAKAMRSNQPKLLSELKKAVEAFPNLEVRVNQTKEEYYYTLLESQIQLNTGDQDFVSWTLLEATTCGCIPIYPDYLSFPEVFCNAGARGLLYNKNDIGDACRQIVSNLDMSLDVSGIYQPFDESWQRMLAVMQRRRYEALYKYNH